MKRHLPLLSRLATAGEAVGDIKESRLREIGLTSYGADVRSAVRREADQYIFALRQIQESGRAVSSLLRMEEPDEKQDYEALDLIAALYLKNKDAEPACLDLLMNKRAEVRPYLERKDALQQWKGILLGIWKEEFLDADLKSILARHEQAAKKIFGKGSAMSAVTAEVQAFSWKPVTYESIPALLQPVQKFQEEKAAVEAARDGLSADAAKLLAEYPSISALEAASAAADRYIGQMQAFPGGVQTVHELNEKADTTVLFTGYREYYQNLLKAEEHFNGLLCRNRLNDSGGRDLQSGKVNVSGERNQQIPEEDWITSEQNFCVYLLEHRPALKDWGLYNQVRQDCINAGLKPAVEAYENGLSADDLIPAYKKGFYYALIMGIIYEDDVLSSFSGATFNESIRQFKRLDDNLLKMAKEEIFYRLASQVPTSWDSPAIGKELNLLRKAIGSNARGMAIRTLFERIPNVLQALCPCMLMSPNSVAQYLAQENDLFDVVIFDEASQLPTCKAVGALYRAKDAVIVGDPRQMPPTSFFAGQGPDVEDLALADLDSILDDALALGIPSQHLQWHYRSTHESLIAFSNSHFYGNHMFTFPSANDRERHVTAVHVDGIYKNSTNVKEAEAVVAEIVQRFHDPKRKNQSVGVVTFNVKQQALIENLLAKQFQNDPALDAWANAGEDPLFVKNLENVQGDERDIILFSITYGPDEKGRISMNFGPINKNGGGKRLNVAFSRSRIEMKIFASLSSSDIKVTENSPEGLIAFRDFLYYAEGHGLPGAATQKGGKEAEGAGILQSVCRIIRENGFQCEPMVGHSDFHVDLAVIDPYEPTKYLMGILLDGDGYRKTRNTRDREVAQISVLRNLGWTLHRIWTIDWWDNRDREIQRLLTKLNTLKAEAEKRNRTAESEEAARKEDTAADEKEITRLRAELETQAAEVVAEEEESEASHPVTSEPEVTLRQEQVENQDQGQSEKQAADLTQTRGTDLLAAAFRSLYQANAQIIDKRGNGGALWVKGGKELSDIMDVFKSLGISFHFKKGGGRATKGEDAWYTQNQTVRIPDFETEGSVEPVDRIVDYSRNTSVGNPEDRLGTSQRAISEKTEGSGDTDYSMNTSVGNPVIRFRPVHTEPDGNAGSDDSANIAGGDSAEGFGSAYVFSEYVMTSLPVEKMSSAEFISPANSKKIQDRIQICLQSEAPIQKELLMRRILKSFNVSKTQAVSDAFEKALKAVKAKTTKQSGVVYCWLRDQDPNMYRTVRGGESSKESRNVTEISQQEMKNAICYVIQEHGRMDKDSILKETSRVLGYQRMTGTISTAIETGLKYARKVKAVGIDSSKNYTLQNEQ